MKWLRLRAAGSKRKHRRQSIASRSGANNPCPGEAVRFATVHYLAGRRDLRWVSNLQTSQLTAEADLVKLDGLRQMNRITLLLALGGSFEATPAAIVRETR